MNSPPCPAADDEPRKGAIGKIWAFIWAFLNRDIRTFKWWRRNKAGPQTDDVPPSEVKTVAEPLKVPEPEIASEVDPRQIEDFRFRREVLDWRDEFHFQVTETASQAKTALAKQVDHELATMNFWRRRVFRKPASEVLKGHIESCVQAPMRKTAQIEQAALRQRLLTWLPHHQETSTISVIRPRLEWDTRLLLKFTADNRDRILVVLGELILGENGLADRHRQWATQCAGQILEMRHGRPDSI